MIRLLLALLCALGLAFSPMTAVASPLRECTMRVGEMPDMPADHSEMSCCAPACQAPSAAAVLTKPDANPSADLTGRMIFAPAPMKELHSTASSGLDPPPRA